MTQPDSRRSTQQLDVHAAILAWVRDDARAGNTDARIADELERSLRIHYTAPGTLIYELPAADAATDRVLRKALSALNLAAPAKLAALD